ncbi:hypothetical protein LTR84_006157 [Exophiala bonariae]|uniref:Uncharacterized protein n=1 Tax=Exophiala bonariae TaxID=1690606 RepID=A0AAV9N2X4_9EURO|nr:hypothetical protein LTR84_006157 [Exophiala bonariae]
MDECNNTLFNSVRTKLRHSRSSIVLPVSTTNNHESSIPWDNVPVEYRPVQRKNPRPVAGYYASYAAIPQTLPGPPPRPRTASPGFKVQPLGNTTTPFLIQPNPRTYRRRSALDVRNPWSGPQIRPNANASSMDEDKFLSVEIAAALPPDHLDPPPPYSYHPPPPSLPPPPPPSNARHRSWSNQHHYAAVINPHTGHVFYNPGDYQQQPLRTRQVQAVPSISVPTAPTPVSPINSLDAQYLALRKARRKRAMDDLNIDNLLNHPMLSRR